MTAHADPHLFAAGGGPQIRCDMTNDTEAPLVSPTVDTGWAAHARRLMQEALMLLDFGEQHEAACHLQLSIELLEDHGLYRP